MPQDIVPLAAGQSAGIINKDVFLACLDPEAGDHIAGCGCEGDTISRYGYGDRAIGEFFAAVCVPLAGGALQMRLVEIA